MTVSKVYYGVLGVIVLDSFFALCYDWYRERCLDAALEEAYPDSDSDDEEFIKRPEAEERFEKIIKSSPSRYSVVLGSHGTGKSTLAKNVARKTRGAIYVDVPPTVKNEEKLDSALRDALGWRKPILRWLPVLLSKISSMATIFLQTGRRVLIFVFIMPLTDQFLPRRLAAKRRNTQYIEGFRAGCRPLQSQAWLLRRPHYRQHQCCRKVEPRAAVYAAGNGQIGGGQSSLQGRFCHFRWRGARCNEQ